MISTGGSSGGGGLFGYGGAGGQGGGGGTSSGGTKGTGGISGLDANTSGRDAPLGGTGGSTQVGSGGASSATGGTVGRGGSSGTTGASGGSGGAPGTGGVVVAGDAAVPPQVDGGDDRPPACPSSFSGRDGISCAQAGFTGVCKTPESPSVCWCDPDSIIGTGCTWDCPASPVPGSECRTPLYCYYNWYGLCVCALDEVAGKEVVRCAKGNPPRDAGPDVSRPPMPKTVLCAEDPGFGSCTDTGLGYSYCGTGCQVPSGATEYYCVREDGRSSCRCDGRWACGNSVCPNRIDLIGSPCDEAMPFCMLVSSVMCRCKMSDVLGLDAPAMRFDCVTTN
jgi:hypothetical protein